MQNAIMQQLGGGAGTAGIDPSSGIQGANMLAGLLGIGQMRRENLRDFTQMSETLRRQDIGLGQQLLSYMYGTGMEVANQRAQTWLSQMGGQGNAMGAQIQAGNPFLGALGNVGDMMANYKAPQSTPASQVNFTQNFKSLPPPSTSYKPAFSTNWTKLSGGRW